MARRSSIMIRRSYYQVAMVTLFTVLLWVSVSIYLALISAPDVGVEASLLTPVSPTIDQSVVASLSARTQISATAEELVKEISPATGSAEILLDEPTPSPSEAPLSTESAEPTPTPTE